MHLFVKFIFPEQHPHLSSSGPFSLFSKEQTFSLKLGHACPITQLIFPTLGSLLFSNRASQTERSVFPLKTHPFSLFAAQVFCG